VTTTYHPATTVAPSVAPALGGVADKVTAADRDKISMPGTDRAWPVDVTLAKALRCAPAVGITRLADVTRLDRIGIPTHQAVRPASTTLSVSQGKGLSHRLAQVSALMESIEYWHAENPVTGSFAGTIRELRPVLAYDPYTLPLVENSLLHDGLPLRWTTARRLPDGRAVPVPCPMVELGFTDPTGWRPRAFRETTTGLASGNTFVEATVHGLYEVLERDAASRAHRLGVPGTRFDPRTLGSPAVDGLLDRFEAAEVTVDLRILPSPAGLPVVSAAIASEDYQLVAVGYGCHLAAEIAATRALTEAAQSRLTAISGARDDLPRAMYRSVSRMMPTPLTPGRAQPPPLPPRICGARSHQNLLDDLADLNERCMTVFSAPLLVDLTRPEIGIPVVRVIVPGCELNEGAE
jgi:ribosomal protein S12 methylthiotransferase accessory factor